VSGIQIDKALAELLGGAPSNWEFRRQHGGGDPIHQASPQAMEFAEALLQMIAAKVELQAVQNGEHTFGWRDTSREEDNFNKAVDRLWKVVGGR
jgi:hypothetical protein